MISESLKKEWKNASQSSINDEFTNAVKEGNLEKIRYLLTSKEIDNNAYIHINNDSPLITACYYNYSEIVYYLLSSPELKDHADIHAQENEAFQAAILSKNIEMIQFLLTSPQLKKHSDIHSQSEAALENALIMNNVEITSYLLSSSHLKAHSDIHKVGCETLLETLKKLNDDGAKEVLHYLIFDYKLEIPDEIKSLENDTYNEIIELFNKRELEQKLNNNLNEKLIVKKNKL